MRDYASRPYRKWRAAVKRRDRYRCRVCKARKGLQVHHIKTWAEHPELRFVVANGITLCKRCHAKVWGQEAQFEAYFRNLVDPDTLIRIQRLLYDARKAQEKI